MPCKVEQRSDRVPVSSRRANIEDPPDLGGQFGAADAVGRMQIEHPSPDLPTLTLATDRFQTIQGEAGWSMGQKEKMKGLSIPFRSRFWERIGHC